MKYKTFSLIRKIVIIVLSIIVVVWLFSSLCSRPKRTTTINENYTKMSKEKVEYGADRLPITDIDKIVMEYQKKDITQGKIDDQGDSYKMFITTSDYKIDMRCDFKKGYSYWNRIKVDFDKDKKWDEKWSFQKDGNIKKEVSPNDDEKYEYTYILKDKYWEKK